jgi:hypothetical protein
MTDVRKVISQIGFGSGMVNSTNYYKTPESDRPVFYSSTGHIDTDLPLLRSTVRAITVANASDARTNANAAILAGVYFASNTTMQPSDVDLNRQLIRAVSGAGNSALTFPNPGGAAGLIPYLKRKYGADKIVPGLWWEFKIMNDQTVNNVVLTIADPGVGNGTVNTQGWDISAAPVYTVTLAGTTAKRNTVTIGVLLGNTTPGSESITWYAF